MTPKTLDKYIAALKKKAAAGGWSEAEYQAELDKIKNEMAQQYLDNKMTAAEYTKVSKQLDNATKNPGLAGKPKPAKAGKMTDDELQKLQKDVMGMALNGKISHYAGNQLMDMLKYLQASGLSQGQAKNQLDSAVNLLGSGFSVEESMNVAAGYKPGMSAGMTKDEYVQLVAALNKKQAAGLITSAEYDALAKKLDDAYHANKTMADIVTEIGCDPGSMAAADAILDLGKEIKGVYKQAASEMQTKLDEFLKKYGPEIDELNQKAADGTITEDEAKRLEMLLLQKAIMGQKAAQLAGIMTQANKKAIAMVNGKMMGVFAENAAWQSYQLTQDTKLDLMFSIYDEHTVEKLIKDKPELLPRKEVNGKKDAAWNQQIIANSVAQGILQGESIPKLARRIAADTGEKNSKAMMRYARTAMTSAQNSGRIEMLHRAEGMGIKVKKRWLATLDGRTRDSHRHMDGVTAKVDDDFVTPLGSHMKYPGDMSGDAKGEDIWNCRCTLVYDYEDYPADPTADMRRDNETGQVIANMPYDEWKAAKEGSILNELSMAKTDLAEAQKEFIAAGVKEDKVYNDIWKDPVTLADYPDKAGSIQAKRDYYEAEIQKYKDAKAAGSSWATDEKIKELQKKLKLLNEFEKHGKLLQKRNAALKKVQDLYGKAGIAKKAAAPEIAKKAKKAAKKKAADSGDANTGTDAGSTKVPQTPAQKGQFAPDAWEDKTKKAAPFYRSKYDADKVLRPELDAMWNTLTDTEKYAVWEYTANSNPINKRLSGYGDTRDWSRRDFVGYENAIWSLEDSWRPLPSYWKRFGQNGHSLFHKAITHFTKAIEKSELHEDIWFKRQSGEGGFAGILEGAGMDFNQAMYLIQTDPSKLIGMRAKNHAFTSCGMAQDAEWTGNVYYKIYCPKGTKGIYSEPQSNFGRTSPSKIYQPGDDYSRIGSEAEVVLQRGTEFRITGIKRRGSDYEVEMEVVAQPDYFVHGDEDTYNNGKTRHAR